MDKKVIYFFSTLGLLLGGLVPLLWGGSAFGGMSVLFGLIGGLLGVWLGIFVSRRLG